ncbi:CsbD family protein [Arthrobacter sp. NPDC056886]|uniref:CsbD family protein n=1 Tax=Arthrobacter sp. NPDC056886 TaxID=3345960 RepID=UPI003672A202
MGIDDKAHLTVIHHIGAAKEGTGKVTGDEDLQREGRHEQAQAELLETGEGIEDSFAKE